MLRIRLRNDTVVPEVIAKDVFRRLQRLNEIPAERPLLEELLKCAHDNEHQLSAESRRKLESKGLIPLQPMARNVVLSALYGFGKDIVLVDPNAKVNPELKRKD